MQKFYIGKGGIDAPVPSTGALHSSLDTTTTVASKVKQQYAANCWNRVKRCRA